MDTKSCQFPEFATFHFIAFAGMCGGERKILLRGKYNLMLLEGIFNENARKLAAWHFVNNNVYAQFP
jgi:hypothetical protein